MKKLSSLIILAVIGLFMVECKTYDRNPFYEVRGFYESPHQLRKMFVQNIKSAGEGHLSGGFFAFVGGIAGDYKEGVTTTHVQFAWNIKNGRYILTELPLEKIQIQLTEKNETPTVSFVLDENEINRLFGNSVRAKTYEEGQISLERGLGRILKNYSNPKEAIAKYLAYAVFTVRSEDWPTDINLPMNQAPEQ